MQFIHALRTISLLFGGCSFVFYSYCAQAPQATPPDQPAQSEEKKQSSDNKQKDQQAPHDDANKKKEHTQKEHAQDDKQPAQVTQPAQQPQQPQAPQPQSALSQHAFVPTSKQFAIYNNTNVQVSISWTEGEHGTRQNGTINAHTSKTIFINPEQAISFSSTKCPTDQQITPPQLMGGSLFTIEEKCQA